MMHRNAIGALALGMVLLAGTSITARGEDGGWGLAHPPAPLEGAWNVAIRPYDCATGETIPGVVFRSRLTFHGDGTLAETTSNPNFMPGQRGVGAGYWERIGRTSYRAVFEAYILFDSAPGMGIYTRGTQRVDQGIELTDRDHWTSRASVVFRDEAGNVVPPSGCMTASAERLQ